MTKVLVTGAGGYIGSQLVSDLLKLGNEVTAVDRFFFGKEPISNLANNNKLILIQKDIRGFVSAYLIILAMDPSAKITIYQEGFFTLIKED